MIMHIVYDRTYSIRSHTQYMVAHTVYDHTYKIYNLLKFRNHQVLIVVFEYKELETPKMLKLLKDFLIQFKITDVVMLALVVLSDGNNTFQFLLH